MDSGLRNVSVQREQSDQSSIHFLNKIPIADCIENYSVSCCVDRVWFCGRGAVDLCFLCLIMSHFVTLSIIGIEVSPFTVALISLILIHIQAASLLLNHGRVGVGNPNRQTVHNQTVTLHTVQQSESKGRNSMEFKRNYHNEINNGYGTRRIMRKWQ